MNKIYVLGVGPGSSDYILPVVWRKAEECDALFGGSRNLKVFQSLGKQHHLIASNIGETIREIKEQRKEKQVGILVSGDPGLYSFLSTLLKHIDRNELEVYPGISSLQYLFARGALPWQDARIMSLHGRRIDELADFVRNEAKLAFLVDNKFPVGDIARFLIEQGVTGKRALVGQNLSYENESIIDLPLENWSGKKVADLSVMVIYNDKE